MKVGIISGSGSYDWPSLSAAAPRTVHTRYGEVEVTEGRVGGADVVHLSRHGRGHARLSNHVAHRANIAAMRALDVDAVLSLTVCGALDPAAELGSLVVFDDLYFPSNRLPDGSLCTWFDTPSAPERGHWIAAEPFSPMLRRLVVTATAGCGVPIAVSGCYGHVDGPRFNTRPEVAALAAAGVTAISQTAGPEVVLAGEARLPLVLLGYLTDHANGVRDTDEPVEVLLARVAASASAFTAAVSATLDVLAGVDPGDLAAPGVVHQVGQ